MESESKTDAKSICVKDIMTKNIIMVDGNVSSNETAKLMDERKVGAVIVTDNNTPVGIITDRDFATKIVAHAYPFHTPVKQIMSSPLIAIQPNESVWMITDLMYTRGIRKLPVIEEDNVVGIVTATDLVNEFAVCTEEDMRKMYYQSITKLYDQCRPYG